MDYVYSKAHSDADRIAVNPKYPTEIKVNEGEKQEDFVNVFNYKMMKSVKKIVLNYTYNTMYGDDEDAPITMNGNDSGIFFTFYNLEELWLGPNVDVADFLSDYAVAHAGYSGKKLLYR